MFEMTLSVRDAQGQPTNMKKSIQCEKAYDLWKFYVQNTAMSDYHKHKGRAATAKEASVIVKEMNKSIEKN